MAEIWLEMVVKRQFVSLLFFVTPSSNQFAPRKSFIPKCDYEKKERKKKRWKKGQSRLRIFLDVGICINIK